MRRYQPTTKEIDVLFSVNASLNDAIEINNDHFMMMKQRTNSEKL
jgi:hypothetical protein